MTDAASISVTDYARTVLASRKVEGLGHSTVVMTEKYAKILDEDLLNRVGARNDNAIAPPPDTQRELPASLDTERDLSAYDDGADNDVQREAM